MTRPRIQLLLLSLLASVTVHFVDNSHAYAQEVRQNRCKILLESGFDRKPTYELVTMSTATIAGKDVQLGRLCHGGTSCVVLIDKPRVAGLSEEAKVQGLVGEFGKLIESHDSSPKSVSNCHSWACQQLHLDGLPKNIWIQGFPFPTPESTNPMRLILEHSFHQIATFSGNELDLISRSTDLRPGDLIVYVDSSGNYSHSGLISKILRPSGESENWIRSKIGEFDVIETPFSNLEATYPALLFVVYRKNVPSPQ